MIQKYIPVPTTKEIMLREIRSVQEWPTWMPGVESADLLKSDGPRSVIRLVIKAMSKIEMTMELDCCDENKIRFRQLKGWFKSYSGEYTVLPAPSGSGIVFRVALEADAGMFAPKGMVQSRLGAMLDQFEQALHKRVQHCAPAAQSAPAAVAEPRARGSLLAPARPAAPAAAIARPRRKLVHVFPVRGGVEVWIAGRPHRLRAIG